MNEKILAADARFPGSVHDAEIWSMSNIRDFLHGNFVRGDEITYLIGDSGYPLLPYLLTPIRGAPHNTPEGRYTCAHTEIRNCIGKYKWIVEKCMALFASGSRVTLSSSFCSTDFLCLCNSS